jgi:hypothetical protein
MREYIILHRSSAEISEIVAALKSQGYVVHQDFDFEYSPGRYDWAENEQVPRQTKFIFYNEKLSTWFVLKWM